MTHSSATCGCRRLGPKRLRVRSELDGLQGAGLSEGTEQRRRGIIILEFRAGPGDPCGGWQVYLNNAKPGGMETE